MTTKQEDHMATRQQTVAINLLSTNDAAQILGVSRRRVLQLIASNRLPATMIGDVFLIRPDDLMLVADRPPGRPRKKAS